MKVLVGILYAAIVALAVITFFVVAYLIVAPRPAHAAGPYDACAEHLPWGTPTIFAPIHGSPVCHTGYAALVDSDALVPRWVSYRLTESRTLGCGARLQRFHVEQSIKGRLAHPADYAGSGFDIGHMAPAEDFAWDKGDMNDSFSLANAAPQLPGLNRQEWERLEENVRGWAWERGEVIVYVGPVLGSNQTVGRDKVAVPTAFWKIIVDAQRHQALAFQMPQRALAKGDLRPWQTSIGAIASHTAISFPLPPGIDTATIPPLWDDATPGWRVAHAATCRH